MAEAQDPLRGTRRDQCPTRSKPGTQAASRARAWAGPPQDDDQQQESRSTADDVQRELTGQRDQQDRLLNLRLLDEIDAGTFARKNTELRDLITCNIRLRIRYSNPAKDECEIGGEMPSG